MREIMRPSLAKLTTLRLGGTAIAELVLEDKKDFDELPEKLAALGGSPVILGRGSNILAKDGELPIVIIHPAFKSGPRIIGQKDDRVLVEIGSGRSLASLLGFCLKNELSGLEGLCGIPASVGGAIAMNAGSFGCQTGQCLEEVLVASGGDFRVIKKDQLKPSYRQMELTGVAPGWIAVSAIFGLTRKSKSGILNAMRLNFFEKKSRQPINVFTAGSTFKNPEGDISAGKMLDLAGFRGKRLGGVAFSEKHANFLVNEGHGSAEAALSLIGEAREAVLRKFGCRLDLEVKIIPCHLP